MTPIHVTVSVLERCNLEVTPSGVIETAGGAVVGSMVSEDTASVTSGIAEYLELCEESGVF